jgi:hypothetical protein
MCYSSKSRSDLGLWIRGLKERGLKPVIVEIERADAANWATREQHHIRVFRQSGHALLNKSIGGEGSLGYSHSKETIEFLKKHNRERHRSTYGTSEFRGVSFNKKRRKWYSQISILGVTTNLGVYDSEKQAALAYNRAIKENGLNRPINDVRGEKK